MPNVPLLKLKAPLTTRLPVLNVPPSTDRLPPTGMVVVLVTFRVVVGVDGEVIGRNAQRLLIKVRPAAPVMPKVPLTEVKAPVVGLTNECVGGQRAAAVDGNRSTILDNQSGSVHELPSGIRAGNVIGGVDRVA